jgi:hypothetical protein
MSRFDLRRLLRRLRRRTVPVAVDDAAAVLQCLRVERDMTLAQLLDLETDALLEQLERWQHSWEVFEDWHLDEIWKARELLGWRRVRAEIRELPETDAEAPPEESA